MHWHLASSAGTTPCTTMHSCHIQTPSYRSPLRCARAFNHTHGTTHQQADLNGDSASEIIVAGHDAKVLVLTPRHGVRPGTGFAHARVVGYTSLAPPQEPITKQWDAIALAVGHIDPPPEELVKAPRKQVLVVVTANLHVHCFDHNLRLMWTKLLRVCR